MASIMIKYNVSPETVVSIDDEREGFEIPELKVKVLARPGLIPLTLRAMRDKRLALKGLLKSLEKEGPAYRAAQRRYRLAERLLNVEAVTDALKWLTVVCYGRLRFANSIFGRINSHEVVSYLSRKTILQAKRIAEERGGRALHLYVDSLFVSLPGATQEDFDALAKEIGRQTGLPMELENVYSWFAFLSSRQNPNISVANKFFGVAANGEHKLRGIAVRRGDTCAFVADIQRRIIEILAREKDPMKLGSLLPEVLEVTHERFGALKAREVELDQLVVSQTLSRELNGYSVLSPTAVAARQLQAQGTTVQRGQRVRFLYLAQPPGVQAWELPAPPDPRDVDVRRYRELAFRAIYEVLEPLGVRERLLRDWIFHGTGYVMPDELLDPAQQRVKQDLPMLADLRYLRVDTF
jgi:DNA polymerase elongation subunit (family B)